MQGAILKHLLIIASILASLCTTTVAHAGTVVGWASYYKMGKVTASGERYNMHGFTAAHRTLPFGTLVKVTNLRNGISVVVRINDRGPFIKGRVIDLSFGAAKVVGLHKSGVAKIKFTVLQ